MKARYIVFLICVVAGLGFFSVNITASTCIRGENYYLDGGGNWFSFVWKTSPEFSEEELNYRTGKYYIDIDNYDFAYASHNDRECIAGAQGIYRDGAWKSNSYGFFSCSTNNSWYEGNPFQKSTSAYGQYGSRYLLLSVFHITDDQNYILSPMMTNGENQSVVTDIYMIVHAYGDTKRNSRGPVVKSVYPMVDFSASWYRWDGLSADGYSLKHGVDQTMAANTWNQKTPYLTIMLRAGVGATEISANTNMPIGNGNLAGAAAMTGVDLDDFQYKFICYRPFMYSYDTNADGAYDTTVQRSGCIVTTVPSIKRRVGYDATGYRIVSGGSIYPNGIPVIRIGETYTQEQLQQYIDSGRFSGVLFSNCKFTASYTPHRYSIAFYGNNATAGLMTAMECTYDQTYTLPDNAFSRTGYTFLGWADSVEKAELGIVKYENNASVRSLSSMEGDRINLYAVWQVNSYVVELDGNGATSSTHTRSVSVNYGDILPTIVAPKRQYRVRYQAAGGVCTVTAQTAVYPFEGYYSVRNDVNRKSGNLIYQKDGTSSVRAAFTRNQTVYAAWSSQAVILPEATRTGYRMDGWWTMEDGGDGVNDENPGRLAGSCGDSYTPETSEVLYAHWTYLGEPPNIRYDGDAAESTITCGWYNDASIESGINVGKLTAFDPDGDMISFCLYAGVITDADTKTPLVKGKLSNHFTNPNSPTGADIGDVRTTYRDAVINYDFRKVDSYNTEPEGVKQYTLMAEDYHHHTTTVYLTVKVDLTPPDISGTDYEGTSIYCEGANKISAWRVITMPAEVVGNGLDVTGTGFGVAATDHLSGMQRLSLSLYSAQNRDEKYVVRSPFAMQLHPLRDYPSEPGIILKAKDQAGNITIVLIANEREVIPMLQPYLPK